jgi:hypothetical protein
VDGVPLEDRLILNVPPDHTRQRPGENQDSNE